MATKKISSSDQFSQEEIDAAASVENSQFAQEQLAILQRRVVLLRASIRRLTKENEELKEQLAKRPKAPSDRKPRTKKATVTPIKKK